MGPSSEKEQQCDNHAKLSRQIHVCKERKGMSQRTGRSIRDQRCKELTPAGWFFHLGGLSWSEGATIITWRPFLVESAGWMGRTHVEC